MGNCDVVVLALSSLSCEVILESRFPEADVLRCIKYGVTQIAGASLFHVGISAGSVELAGLVGRWRESGISQELIRRIETGEVTDFGQNHRSHARPHAGDRDNRRLHGVQNGKDLCFDFLNLLVQLLNQPDGMPKLQRLGRHGSQWSAGLRHGSQ